MFLNRQIYLKEKRQSVVNGTPPPRKSLMDPKDIRKIRCLRIQTEKGYRLWINLLLYCKHHLNTHLDANGGAI